MAVLVGSIAQTCLACMRWFMAAAFSTPVGATGHVLVLQMASVHSQNNVMVANGRWQGAPSEQLAVSGKRHLRWKRGHWRGMLGDQLAANGNGSKACSVIGRKRVADGQWGIYGPQTAKGQRLAPRHAKQPAARASGAYTVISKWHLRWQEASGGACSVISWQ